MTRYEIDARVTGLGPWILVARMSSEKLVPVLKFAREWADTVAPQSLTMRVRRDGQDAEQATVLEPRPLQP